MNQEEEDQTGDQITNSTPSTESGQPQRMAEGQPRTRHSLNCSALMLPLVWTASVTTGCVTTLDPAHAGKSTTYLGLVHVRADRSASGTSRPVISLSTTTFGIRIR